MNAKANHKVADRWFTVTFKGTLRGIKIEHAFYYLHWWT